MFSSFVKRFRNPRDGGRAALAAAALLLFGCWGPRIARAGPPPAERLQFNRDVRPILADKCFHCHGRDAAARQAELRLDRPQDAHADRGGYRAIAAGDAGQSELWRRVTSSDPDERMPPADQQRQLSAGEIAVLKRWIDEGGEYQPHWSFLPPRRPPLPAVAAPQWCRNAIDYFVLARLEAAGLRPSPEADKVTLLRRVTLDLTGLPPTPGEVDRFLADDAPDAYLRAVDRLLDSPRYGERMARVWLDAARFADSGGYQGDILRSMWLWRDWVIDAYNQNMPFDRFTIEQLAGDLLPQASERQQIATGFNRNHRINDEDGIIFEEFRVEYVVDRVETTATVWMGLTLGCARCHDHKYDPFSQREFYQFFAYFNSIDEKGRGHGNAPPLLTVTPPELEARLAALDAQLTALRSELADLPDAPDTKPQREAKQKALDALQQQRDTLSAQAPTTMVMRELAAPRDTFVLVRGAYDRPGEQVAAATPRALTAPDAERPPNRLELARWLVDPAHPLTARVAANRYWQMYFGRGIVATPEDFGTQGALPSHPELLDWLATELVHSGWNVKAMQRLIVTSAAYRQASHGSAAAYRDDPGNLLLGRGARFRLPAETVRDQALAASGLLVNRLGGPSVRPYQPPKLWDELASASPQYVPAEGADLYRRSLYTFVRRTVPPPAMVAFDAPNRETCVVRRARTNTPLQALALMNDPTFVEASRALAADLLAHGPPDEPARLEQAFRRLTARRPAAAEQATLAATLRFYLDHYQHQPDAARQLVTVGESTVGSHLDPARLAAYTAVVSLIMNLDETMTRE